MDRPDFKGMKTLYKAIYDTDVALKNIFFDRKLQEEEIIRICRRIAAEKGKRALKDYSVEELKKAKAGIKVSALQDAGLETLWDIATATDDEVYAVEGVGDKQVEIIRNLITDFANSLSGNMTVKLSLDGDSEEYPFNDELITAVARLYNSNIVRDSACKDAEYISSFAERLGKEKVIKNTLTWLFSGNDRREHTREVYTDMYNLCNSEFFDNVLHIIDRYHIASNTTQQVAHAVFEKNAADFYAILDNLGADKWGAPFVYGSIPAQLAQEIDATELDIGSFTGNLRAYQTFGVKYILHQKNVLLGDEMGLGKTVQAIAAMSHISNGVPGCYFLVVCPASVIVNWEREIHKFSSIKTHILRGQDIDESFQRWTSQGGAAITNYESMGKIVDNIDNHMELQMLVIDEAHFIKNPEAKRTQYLKRLVDESVRILLMTGTPLENKVREMCNLLEFVRPDMTEQILEMAYISHLPEFKELLAPVYLRRTRDMVLKELPAIDERQVWCAVTEEDSREYAEACAARSFQDMRRVSFLQEDTATSSKMKRLLELCQEAEDEERNVVVFSFFRDTVAKVGAALGDKCVGIIKGEVKPERRQELVDKLSESGTGNVLVSQIQAGGVGLNIQAASIVIFCEPQIKPSLTWQALSRVYRMGQVRNVLVYHLLCPLTVDEEINRILEGKKLEFEAYASESAVAEAFDNIIDKEWIENLLNRET